LQAGYARLQNPLILGLGEGQRLQLTKVHPSPSSYLTPGWTMTAHFHSWMMCASTWRLPRKWPRMNTNFTN